MLNSHAGAEVSLLRKVDRDGKTWAEKKQEVREAASRASASKIKINDDAVRAARRPK